MKKRLLSAELSCGDAEIDAEHEAIFRLVELVRKGEALGDVAKDLVVETAWLLADMLEQHLEHEERWMDEIGYPQAAQHKESHHIFREMLHQLYSLFETYAPDSQQLLMDVIQRYLKKHIKDFDIPLIQFHKEKQT